METLYLEVVDWINTEVIPGLTNIELTGGTGTVLSKLEEIYNYIKQIIADTHLEDIEKNTPSEVKDLIKTIVKEDKQNQEGGKETDFYVLTNRFYFKISFIRHIIFIYLFWEYLDIKKNLNLNFDLPKIPIIENYGPLKLYIFTTIILFIIILSYRIFTGEDILNIPNTISSYTEQIFNYKFNDDRKDFFTLYSRTLIYIFIPFEFMDSLVMLKNIFNIGMGVLSFNGGSILEQNSFINQLFSSFVETKNSVIILLQKLISSNNKDEHKNAIKDFVDSFANPMLGKNKIPEFYFEPNTGYIVCNKIGRSINKQICSNLDIRIQVNTSREIKYLINSQQLDSVSIIQGRPIATALVIGWNTCGFDKSKQIKTPGLKYSYQIESDSTVRVFDTSTGQEIYSVHSPQVLGDESKLAQAKSQMCTDIFGKGYQESACGKHFYNVLARAGLSAIFETPDIIRNLLSSSPQTKLDILKALRWKLDTHRKLVSVRMWLTVQPPEYNQYLKSNPQVTQLLESIITDINTTNYQILSNRI